MNEPIKVGDLVWVAKPSLCDGNTEGVGTIFRVEEISLGERLNGRCRACGSDHRLDRVYAHDGYRSWWPLLRLKRIPPLSDLEGEQRKEELHA